MQSNLWQNRYMTEALQSNLRQNRHMTEAMRLQCCPQERRSSALFKLRCSNQYRVLCAVGGEFPVAASSASERAESTEKLKALRGQTVVLVFSMQALLADNMRSRSPSWSLYCASMLLDSLGQRRNPQPRVVSLLRRHGATSQTCASCCSSWQCWGRPGPRTTPPSSASPGASSTASACSSLPACSTTAASTSRSLPSGR